MLTPNDSSSPEVKEYNPIDVSLEASLQLEEMKQGRRDDAPALFCLVDLLRKPRRGFSGQGISMLADIRSFTIFKESLGQVSPKIRTAEHEQLPEIISDFLVELERGVKERNKQKVMLAKQFCLLFNTSLLGREMSELYERRERSDARYISHESVP
jgi:hypothetical protein